MAPWTVVPGFDFTDIRHEKRTGVARVTLNRPEVANSFRAQTAAEMATALEDAANDDAIGVVMLTGAGNKAFCAGGDAEEAEAGYSNELLRNDHKVHTLIREMPKPVIAAVNGYTIGGGRVFQQLCDLSIASETVSFGQTRPKVGSFDAAYGATYLTRLVDEKKTREIWYLCRRYTAKEALDMGLVNAVVPPAKLEQEVDKWCDEILEKSPGAIRALKEGLNALSANISGLETLTLDLLWQHYSTAEAAEWKKAFWEKRPPEWQQFCRRETFPGKYPDE